MANYYIGIIDEKFLKKEFFNEISLINENISLRNAFIEGYKLKSNSKADSIAFLENDKNSKITLDSTGKCYALKLNQDNMYYILNNWAYRESNYKFYTLSDCNMNNKLDESCMKNSTIYVLKFLTNYYQGE